MREDVDLKFRAAWDVFAATWSRFLAPEPTYQAWFAHYLISQFGIDRVAREPMVKKEHFNRDPRLTPSSSVRPPGVHLPHYANRLDRATDGTGLERRVRRHSGIWEAAATAGDRRDGGLKQPPSSHAAILLSVAPAVAGMTFVPGLVFSAVTARF